MKGKKGIQPLIFSGDGLVRFLLVGLGVFEVQWNRV